MRLQSETELKMATLDAVSNGFDVKVYLHAKAKAMIEKPKARPKKTPEKVEVSDDILNPKLYNALRLWRNEEAKRQGLPAYTVLHQKAIIGIANALPTSSKEMLAIPGVGKKVLERYGVQLLEIVDRFRFQEK